ncbi:MAG: endonuclease [Candidatus Zixiibacteriota bacterium]
MSEKKNRYTKIIERLFFNHFEKDLSVVRFSRDEIAQIAKSLKIELPKNLGDILYTFRYRAGLPDSIRKRAPEDMSWAIRSVGRSHYEFFLTKLVNIAPNELLAETKIPDATPGIIARYALNDEQGLLAKVRYNRLIDVFTGVVCYSLQSHLRTAIPGMGQVETDEFYVGVDKQGVHYAFPVQGKGGKDKIGVVQIEQDLAMCRAKFPSLICKPIAAQFMKSDVIALFMFEETPDGVRVSNERHYRLVEETELTDADLLTYRKRIGEQSV